MSDIRIKMAKDLRDMSDMVGDLHWMAAKAVEDLIKKDGEIAKRDEELRLIKAQEPVVIDRPEYSHQGMGCGLEDADITDRYEAMQYGFDQAIDQYDYIITSHGHLYAAPVAKQVVMPDADHSEDVRTMVVPDGWKLVPVEPTPEMVCAAEEAHMPFGDMDIALRMAILSAPSAPATVQGVNQQLLEGLLRHAQKQVPTGSGLHMRIDAALSAGK